MNNELCKIAVLIYIKIYVIITFTGKIKTDLIIDYKLKDWRIKYG